MDNYQNEITSDSISSKKQMTSYEINQFLIRIGLLIIMIIAHFLLPTTTLKVETISAKSNFGVFSSSVRVSPADDGIMSFSLSQLAFDHSVDAENTDINDEISRNIKENHKSAINTVLTISGICFAICAVFVIKTMFHIANNNSFKASKSLYMAFIPMLLANISLIILTIATTNYVKPDDTLDFDIIGKAYPSIFFFVLFAAAIAIHVNSRDFKHLYYIKHLSCRSFESGDTINI